MDYTIDLGQWNSIFAVPSSVVDRHIKLASEAQLKVLLIILRNPAASISAEAVAKAAGISEDEVANAVEFWIERGLLKSVGGTLQPSEADNTQQVNVEQHKSDESPKKHTAISRAVRPDTAFVTKLLSEDSALAGLMEEAQSVLKKPLSPGDTATLVMLYDTFGLPCEVLALLLNYVDHIGSANMRTVERLGINWSDNGVYSAKAAEQEIARLTSSRNAWNSVSKLLGFHRAGNPTKAQTENANRWVNEWGFNDEMILEAYERCVNSTGDYSMSYTNAILKKWYEKKIFSLEALKTDDAAAAKKAPKKQKSSRGSVFSNEGASFDIKKYEEQSIFDD